MGSTAPPSTTDPDPQSLSSPTINGIQHTKHAFTQPQGGKPTILHLGDPIQHNHDLHARLLEQFDIIKPDALDLERSAFVSHLKKRTWGNFSAIMRPFWRSGNTMADWDRELIELLPESMKVMASAGAGYDWVDTRCLAEHGIVYCNGAHASTESVADMALHHIISVFRHMTASSLAARSRSPSRWQKAHNQVPAIAHNPRGHTLGIVGLGNIGFAIAVKVKLALGMKILYNDILRKEREEEKVEARYFEKIEDMLPKCHCVLIATPAGPQILTAKTIQLLPHGARVVNIARGSLIDEDALADALESGHIDAAALDVHTNEPRVNERLAQMSNVELTSHTGGGSVETNIAFEKLSMENCEAVLNGEPPLTPVNLQWLKLRPPLGEKNHDVDGQNHDRHDEVKQEDPQADTHVDSTHAKATSEGLRTLLEAQVDTGVLPPTNKIHNADHTNGVT